VKGPKFSQADLCEILAAVDKDIAAADSVYGEDLPPREKSLDVRLSRTQAAWIAHALWYAYQEDVAPPGAQGLFFRLQAKLRDMRQT
jgi:hypothetical protein